LLGSKLYVTTYEGELVCIDYSYFLSSHNTANITWDEAAENIGVFPNSYNEISGGLYIKNLDATGDTAVFNIEADFEVTLNRDEVILFPSDSVKLIFTILDVASLTNGNYSFSIHMEPYSTAGKASSKEIQFAIDNSLSTSNYRVNEILKLKVVAGKLHVSSNEIDNSIQQVQLVTLEGKGLNNLIINSNNASIDINHITA
jgi:effector-binding domain-containing protein